MRFYICSNPFHNGIKRCAGSENGLDAGIVKKGEILFRNDSTADDGNILSVFFAQKFHNPRKKFCGERRKDSSNRLNQRLPE